MSRCHQLLIGFGLLLALALKGTAAETTFALTDYLGRDWAPQLVSYRVRFEAPVDVKNLRLLDAAGQPLPFQLGEVQEHGGRLVSALVSFLAALPANGSASYTLTDAAAPAVPSWPLLATVSNTSVELGDTARVRLAPLGTKRYKTPLPAAQAPAPLLAFRLADDTWAGGSALQSTRKITAFSGTLTANGPVFAEVVYRYEFAPKGYYQITIRAIAGLPLACIDESFDFGEFTDGQDLLALKLSAGWNPPLVGWCASRPFKTCDQLTAQLARVQNRGWHPDARAGIELHYRELPLSAAADENDGNFVQPWGAWGVQKPMPPTAARITVQPWMDWGTGADFLCLGKETPAGKSLTEAGFIVLHTGAWRRPSNCTPSLRVTKDGAATLELPISCFGVARPFNPFDSAEEDPLLPMTYGRRLWGLTLAPLDKVEDIAQWRLQYGYLGLDSYKDWVLEWPDGREAPAPQHLYATAAELEQLRATLATNPHRDALAKLYQIDPTDANGSSSAARAGDLLAQRLQQCGTSVVSHFRQAEQDNGVAPFCDDALSWPQLPAAQRKVLRARIAAMCYLLSDADFNPRGVGIHLGNPNMPINRYMGLVQYANTIPTHPRYHAWMDDAARYVSWKLADNVSPAGPWREEICYQQAAVPYILEAMLPLEHAGLTNALMLRHMIKIHRYMLAVTTPPDLNSAGARVCDGTGNGTICHADSMPLLATLVRKSDPKLAGQMMWLWQAAKGDLQPGYSNMRGQTQWLAVPTDISPTAPADIPGCLLPGLGATARANFGAPGETFLLFRQGHNQSHYDMDQGTFKFYANGELLTPNSSLGYNTPAPASTQHGIISFGDPEWTNNHGRVDSMIVDYAYLNMADHLLGRQHFDEKSNGNKAPFDWYRQFVLLKSAHEENPGYLVLRDTFRGTTFQPSHWHSWVLGKPEGITVNGNRATVTTPQGNKFDLLFAAPKAIVPRLTWKPTAGGAGCGFPTTGATLLQVDQPAGEGYFLLLYPRKAAQPAPAMESPAPGVMKITTLEGVDWVFMSPDEDLDFQNDEVRFSGRTGVIRVAGDTVSLAMLAGAGTISFQGHKFSNVTAPFETHFSRMEAPLQSIKVPPAVPPLPIEAGELKAVETLQPGVLRGKLDRAVVYLFNSPEVIDFQQDGVVFHGRRGAVALEGEKVRCVLGDDPQLVHLARIGYRDFLIRGEGPFDLTFSPPAGDDGGEVTGTAAGRARLLEMPLPKNLVPANCAQKALPADQIAAQISGPILTGIAPTLYLNDEQWQLGYYDRGLALPLFACDNKIRITRFYVPPLPATPERAGSEDAVAGFRVSGVRQFRKVNKVNKVNKVRYLKPETRNPKPNPKEIT